MRFFKHGIAVALVIAVAVTVVGCSKSTNKTTEVPEGVAVVVNGNNIMVAEIDKRVNQLLSSSPEVLAGTDKDAKRAQLREEALEQLISMTITLDEAEKQGIKVSDKEFKDGMKKLMKDNGIKDEAALNKILKDKKISYEDFKKDYVERTLVKKLGDKLTKDVKVTDKEAKNYYLKNKTLFATQDQVQVQHILVQKLEQAKNIVAELKKDADFGKLAKKYSIDPGSKDNGGEYPMTPVSNYVKEFGEGSMALEPGQFTETPVKTEYGYHIIKLMKKIKGEQKEFAEVKDQVEKQMLDENKGEFLNKWLKKARDKAKVVKSLKESTTTTIKAPTTTTTKAPATTSTTKAGEKKDK
jgi:parvulin-like peptidyl-prolyl isomerase